MSADKILITGGAGFLGSHLCERLVERGTNVVVMDNLSTGSLRNLGCLEGHPNFEFIEGDVLDTDSVSEAIQDCDTVLHLAASRDVRLSAHDTKIDFEQNLVGTHTLLESVKNSQRCRRIVFTSTSAVYGEPNIIPTPETYGPLQPLSLYGASKLGCEGMISAYSHLFGIDAIICRLANIVGPRCDHGIVHDLMTRVLKGEGQLDVLGNGKQSKSYVYVDDFIDALLLLLRRRVKGTNIINVGSSDSLQVKDIVSIVKNAAGIKSKPVERYLDHGDGRGWPGDVRTMLLDCNKITSAGWNPSYSSALAIEATATGLSALLKSQQSSQEFLPQSSDNMEQTAE